MIQLYRRKSYRDRVFNFASVEYEEDNSCNVVYGNDFRDILQGQGSHYYGVNNIRILKESINMNYDLAKEYESFEMFVKYVEENYPESFI